MTACLLVGGEGTRVAHLTGGHPKCYMSVAGRPWIEWVVDNLESGGIDHIVLAEDPYGTGGAVKSLLHLLPAEGFFVLNGDTYLPHVDYQRVWDTFTTSRKSGCMMVYPHYAGNTSCIVGHVFWYEKGGTQGMWTDCGGIYTPALWEGTPPTPTPFDMEVVIQKAIHRDSLESYKLWYQPYEVGSPEGLLKTEAYLESLH